MQLFPDCQAVSALVEKLPSRIRAGQRANGDKAGVTPFSIIQEIRWHRVAFLVYVAAMARVLWAGAIASFVFRNASARARRPMPQSARR
jgi:hypothetical protein